MAKIELETGGTLWKLLVKEGEEVEAGQELFIMEVMKMEVPYDAPVAGKVSKIHLAEGEAAEEGVLALEIEES